MHADTSAAPRTAPAPAAWRPPALVKASMAWHAGVGVAVATLPAQWPWGVAAIGLNHLLLSGVGLWPQSNWLGPNLSRLPDPATRRGEVAVTLDDGPDPDVTPAALDLLDAHAARATFFCIAERARTHPALCREIVRRGHSVQNHSLDHSHRFSLLGGRAFEREIGSAQRILADITGQLPRFFRAPAGVRNPLLGPVLQRLDLALVSWTRRGYDTVQREPSRVLRRLTRSLAAGDILLLHDGNAARGADGRPVSLTVLPQLLDAIAQRGLRSVTLPEAMRAEAAAS